MAVCAPIFKSVCCRRRRALSAHHAKLKRAAILMPIIEKEDGLHMLLIRRAEHLRSHPGQVAFPGGAEEEGDQNLIQTALREAEEEVGLPQSHVGVAGFLDLHQTPSGYLILPVIGFVQKKFSPKPDQSEVAEIFDAPLSFLMNPTNHQEMNGRWNNQERIYYAMPYRQHKIWGVTAGILRNLYERAFMEKEERRALLSANRGRRMF